jgi:hypothetical protein
MRIFQPDDKLYFFGFSGGAYTARALCGMLHIIGLLREDNEGLIPYAIRMIKQKKIDFAVAADSRRPFVATVNRILLGSGTLSAPWAGYTTSHTSPARKRRTIPTCGLFDTRSQLMSAGHSFGKICSAPHMILSRTSRNFGLRGCIRTLAAATPSQRANFQRLLCSRWFVRPNPKVFE